ncbi:hypothetical protein SANTM175S_02398 [Streptomyces antimycoticus]
MHLENGRDLVIKAPRNSERNVYVQGLKVNGKAWNSTALPHSVIARGGTLEFAMGAKPSAWGTGKNAAPSSIAKDDKVPTPRHDLTVPSGGTALLDNTSGTEAALRVGGPPAHGGGPRRAVHPDLVRPEQGPGRMGAAGLVVRTHRPGAGLPTRAGADDRGCAGRTPTVDQGWSRRADPEMLRFMPEPVADGTLEILGDPTADEQRVSPDVERVLGRPPRRFAEWALRNIAAFR